jgi:hypothetical protein
MMNVFSTGRRHIRSFFGRRWRKFHKKKNRDARLRAEEVGVPLSVLRASN